MESKRDPARDVWSVRRSVQLSSDRVCESRGWASNDYGRPSPKSAGAVHYGSMTSLPGFLTIVGPGARMHVRLTLLAAGLSATGLLASAAPLDAQTITIANVT